jgi:hypothetical protein
MLRSAMQMGWLPMRSWPPLGPTLGPPLGPTLGPPLGPTLGPTLGTPLGPPLGPLLGTPLGTPLSPPLRPTLGPTLRTPLGPPLGPHSKPISCKSSAKPPNTIPEKQMTTITLHSHVYQNHEYYEGSATSYYIFNSKCDALGLYIGPIDVEYTIPSDFNPVAAEVASIEDLKLKALDAYNNSVQSLNERLSKLQAITA